MKLAAELNIPESEAVEPRLARLQIYKTGNFVHGDSKRNQGSAVVATMVILLPSAATARMSSTFDDASHLFCCI